MAPSRAWPVRCVWGLSCLLLALAASREHQDSQGSVSDGSESGSASVDKPRCPPPGLDSVANLNLAAYISAPWYVQKQVPVQYQRAEDLYCVRARYAPRNQSDLSQGLRVFNSANSGSVSGPSTSTKPIDGSGGGMELIALPDPSASGPTATSKLLVGPEPAYLRGGEWEKSFGPYWVVAVGPSNNSNLAYDWAVVLGGAPTTPTDHGCRTGSPDKPQAEQYAGGLWLLSRRPKDPEATAAMEEAVRKLGLDTTELLPVTHDGCTYPQP